MKRLGRKSTWQNALKKWLFRAPSDSLFDSMAARGKMPRVRSEMARIVREDRDTMRKLAKHLYVISTRFSGTGN